MPLIPATKPDGKNHPLVELLTANEAGPPSMNGEECRELLRATAANLVRRAAKLSTAELMLDTDGHIGRCVRGIFTKLEPCNDPGSLTLELYAKRLFHFFGCGHDVYVIAFVYVDRLFRRHPDLIMSLGDVKRWLLASVVLAVKWHEDVCNQYPDEHYATTGGVTLAEFRSLEARLLGWLGWELHVTSTEFDTHFFLAVALSTKAGPLSAASSCTTSPGCSPADSEDEHTGIQADDLDDDEGLRGKPPWSAQSSQDVQWRDALLGEGDCLIGKPLWSTQSYLTCVNEMEDSEEDDGHDDEGFTGWAPWSDHSFIFHTSTINGGSQSPRHCAQTTRRRG